MANHSWDSETEEEIWDIQSKSTVDSPGFTDPSDSDSSIDTNSTIQTDDFEDYFRMEHGRAFPGFEELPTAFPADIDEIQRHRIQHQVVELLAGETLSRIMTNFLTPTSDGRRKSVLDVRTLTGIWAQQTARQFPHVDVKTIDVAPIIPHEPRANLSHEVYDTHLGIIEADNSFDLVHARHSINMMKDWRRMLNEIHRVLRPGGLFIFVEIEPRALVPSEGPATVCKYANGAAFMDHYRAAALRNGILAEACQDIDNWLAPTDPLWASNPGSGFRDVTHWVWEAPTTPGWHPDPVMQKVGALMRMNCSKVLDSCRPLFLSSGISEAEYEGWVVDVRRELVDPATVAVIPVHVVCAFKI